MMVFLFSSLLHLFIGIPLQERAAASPPSIYLVGYFHQGGLTVIYFILCIIIQHCRRWLCCFIDCLATGSPVSSRLCVLPSRQKDMCVCIFSTSFLHGSTDVFFLDSSCVFPLPALDSAPSPGSPHSCFWRSV